MNRKKIKIVNKYRFVFSIFLIIAICFVIVTLLSNSFKVFGEENSNYAYIEVSEGDTVWDIAVSINRDYLDSKEDVRLISYVISQENNLNDYFIYPGQKLIVPLD